MPFLKFKTVTLRFKSLRLLGTDSSRIQKSLWPYEYTRLNSKMLYADSANSACFRNKTENNAIVAATVNHGKYADVTQFCDY
jgi:hypothetical protein